MSATLWQIARRPRWVGALVLALAIAAAFAALGQWQLARSVEGGAATEEQTETTVSLTSVAQPQQPMPSSTIGQLVSVDVTQFVAGDWIVLSDRSNLAEPTGYWVVGHAIVSNGASLAVAVGWTSSADDAASAVRTLESVVGKGELSGRYLPTESPQQSDFEAGRLSALAVPELINLWADVSGGVYSGYVIAAEPTAGLERIDSPPPNNEVSLNLLNIFYAIEWIVFAGFAIFLWYRLVKDVWEEESALTQADSALL